MKISIVVLFCSYLIISTGQCQVKDRVESTTQKTSKTQVQSEFNTSPAIWEATLYVHKNDTLLVDKMDITNKKTDHALMSLPDSISQLPYEAALSTFDEQRKEELKNMNLWFGFTLYLDENGVVQELKYTLANKFLEANPDHCLNENDLLKVREKLKGMQLVLPEWWQEFGSAAFSYVIRFNKL